MAKLLPMPEMYTAWNEWAVKMVEILEAEEENEVLIPPSISFSNLPPANQEGAVLWCPDHADGAGLMYSTGTAWFRVGTVVDDSITRAALKADVIDSTKIEDDAIGQEHMQDDSVGNAELLDNTVDTLEIADDAVTADKLAESYVTAVRGSASVFTKIGGTGSHWKTSRSAATFACGHHGGADGPSSNPPPLFQKWPMERFLHFTSVPITIVLATLSWDNDDSLGDPTLDGVTCTIHHTTMGGSGVHMTLTSWPFNTADPAVTIPMITPSNNWTVADYSDGTGNIALGGDVTVPANSFIFAQVKQDSFSGDPGDRNNNNIYGTFSIEWTVD